jgi:uncharacterized protein (TIRG00374 family)
VPFLLAALLDIQAFRIVGKLLGERLGFAATATAHVAGEAVAMSLPLGVIFSESLRTYLATQLGSARGPAMVAATAARKYLLISSEGISVGLGAALGGALLGRTSTALFGTPILLWLAWGIAALLLVLAAGYAVLVRGGSVAQRCFDLARRLAGQRFAPRVERLHSAFIQTDLELKHLFEAPPGQLVLPSAMYLGVWLLEAAETYVALRLLGADVPWQAVLCIESLLSFVRAIASVLPAGLGVQDLGYALLLQGMGVSDSANVGAAFCVLKRAKEILWMLTGYGAWLGAPSVAHRARAALAS